MTNYERIKAMSIDEMVDFFSPICDSIAVMHEPNRCENYTCRECSKLWLESEANQNEQEKM